MAPVVDAHVHIFPHLGGASGFNSEAEHRQFLQLYMATHGEPVRRLSDHATVREQTLHDGRLDGPSSLRAVNFRVGRFGRFEWTARDTDLYLQFFPPSLQAMESPPEFMLQQMARAGVDRAVLQNARLYGRLDDYFADAVRAYPDKFVGLADVDEANAHTNAQIARLRRAVNELGLRGLYYANRALITTGYAQMFDDPIFDPFWEEVRGLGIPVFWEIVGIPDPNDPDDLLREIERLNRWAERWPRSTAFGRTASRPSCWSGCPRRWRRCWAASNSWSRSCTRSTGRARTSTRSPSCARRSRSCTSAWAASA